MRTAVAARYRAFGLVVVVALGSAGCIPRRMTPSGMLEVGAHPLPTRIIGDRVFVAPVTDDGDTLVLQVESASPASMVYASTVTRLRLDRERLVSGSDTAYLVTLPVMSGELAIPTPNALPQIGQRLFIFPGDDAGGDGEDGFLGQSWLAERTWTFDYPNATLLLLPPGILPRHRASERVPLGFLADESGRRVLEIPRIRVSIGGDSLDLVLDTGASVALSPAAMAVIADGGPAVRAASFVALSVLEAWQARHPGWRVVPDADANSRMPMIEVPEVRVAGQRVGPVWFVAAPDDRFLSRASGLTDQPVVGALGGSVLREFVLTLDYVNGVAIFVRGAGGRP